MTATAPPSASETFRALLQTARAPSSMSTLVTLATSVTGGAHVTLAYVPDRMVLTHESFAAYAAAHTHETLPLETLAATIAADVANELVPKWQRITATATIGGVTHTVAVEDRQPGWEHPSLLTATGVSSMPKN